MLGSSAEFTSETVLSIVFGTRLLDVACLSFRKTCFVTSDGTVLMALLDSAPCSLSSSVLVSTDILSAWISSSEAGMVASIRSALC